MASYSVLIPAHNEASVIARTLSAFGGAIAGPPVLVACNGCSDDTAERARVALPSATVVEIAAAGKAAAINRGLELLPPGPVIVLDADIGITLTMLDALAAVLGEPGVRAASPEAEIDLTGTDRWVRDYYSVFARHFYLAEGIGGSGVYGLSAIGRKELGALPPVMSDDDYVRHFFPLEMQRRVSADHNGDPVRACVRPPQRIGELIRSEARWRAGDMAVRSETEHGDRGLLARVRRRGAGAQRMFFEDGVAIGPLLRYGLIKLAGRAMLRVNRLRRRAHLWHSDTSSRQST